MSEAQSHQVDPLLLNPMFKKLPVDLGYEDILRRVIFVSLIDQTVKVMGEKVTLIKMHNYETNAGFFCQVRNAIGLNEEGQDLVLDITPKNYALEIAKMYRFNMFTMQLPSPRQIEEVHSLLSIAANWIMTETFRLKEAESKGALQ